MTGDLTYRQVFPVLHAMAIDDAQFTREHGVKAAWEAVDPVLAVHPETYRNACPDGSGQADQSPRTWSDA